MIKPGSSPLLKKSYGSRWALLVGVNRYADAAISDLKVCASDVQAVYDLLTTNGYESDRVRLLLSPGEPNFPATRIEILAALTSVAQAAGESDLLLFYFSGHGIDHDGQAYLLPADARYVAIADTAVNLNRVKQIIQESAARAKVIILDACHSGAQIGKAPPGMTEEFVRHVFEEAEGIAILASCKQKQVSWEWPERGQSVFTHYLLEGSRGTADFDEKGFVTVGDINRYVTDRVKTWAVQHSRVQTPTLHCTVAGDIVLVTHSSAANLGPLESTLIITEKPNRDSTESKDIGKASLEEPVEKPLPASPNMFSHKTEAGTRRIDEWIQPPVDFVIVTPLEEERDAVLEKLPGYRRLMPSEDDIRIYFGIHLPVTFPDGSSGTYQVVVMPLLGMGRAQATAATNDAIRRWNPRYVILVGVAGGIEAKGAKLGDVLVPDKIVDYELQKLTDKGPDIRWEVYGVSSRLLGAAKNFIGDDWLKLIDTQRPRRGKPERHIGPIASGDKVVDYAEALNLKKCREVWSKLIGVEMEAGGVALSALQAEKQVRFFMIRGVSDLADGDKNAPQVKKWRPYACDVAASYAIALLKSGPVLPEVRERAEDVRRPHISSPTKPNPFIHGRPVRPGEFLDREPELRTIFNRLRKGESTAVVGEPHIGKTSLLLQLADEETQLRYLGDSAQRVKFSSLNLHYISNDYSPSAFWEKALTPLRNCPGWDSIAWRFEQAAQAGYPGDFLEELFDCLYKQKHQVVLLLDEFERLLDHPRFQDFAFFATLRAVDSFPSLSIVITSRLALEELEERVHELPLSGGSPVFNALQEKRLLPFDENGVAALLNRAGNAFSHDDCRFIRFIAGRHPYLVQTMASALLETTGDDRYARATEQFYNWTRSYSDDLWSTLNERARATIVVLGLVELGNHAAGFVFDYTEIQSVDVLGFRLRDLAQLGLAEQVNANWPFGVQHSLLWRGERWVLGTRALAFWVYDVIIAESHRVSAYDEWLKDKGYCSLLTQEQWDRLLGAVRNACGQKIDGIGTLAGSLFEELVRRKQQ